jgi:benzoylformate decarboxylase
MPTVHQATWELLRALGVRKVFGNPGSTEMPFLADFPDDIDYVLGLHEGAVVGMADVYAQLTGEPTLVNLHTAVGLGNAMGAIINAASGHSPLVITAGQQVRAT